MPKLPALDVRTNINYSPHVMILGAGASLAALPHGDCNGYEVPSMDNLIEVVGLDSVMAKYGLKYEGGNFEKVYSELISDGKFPELDKEIKKNHFHIF